MGVWCLVIAAGASASASPIAQIGSPSHDQAFGLNQTVGRSFSCVDGEGSPGISQCTDSNSSSGSADTGSGSSGSGTLDTSTTGTFTYTVTAISSDGQSSTSSIAYSVIALNPNQTPLQFGSVDMHYPSTQQESFFNQTSAPVTVKSSTITGADASNYSIQAGQDFCTEQTIPAYGSCHLNVVFPRCIDRARPRRDAASLTVTDDAPETVAVPLTATGLTGALSARFGFAQPRFADHQRGRLKFAAGDRHRQSGGQHKDHQAADHRTRCQLLLDQWRGLRGLQHRPRQHVSDLHPVQSKLGRNEERPARARQRRHAGSAPGLADRAGPDRPVALGGSATEAKYGKVPLGSSASQTLTLSNGGDAPLQIQGVILIAGSQEVFPISNDGCSGKQVAAGSSCHLTVGFVPIAGGVKDGSLLVITNVPPIGVRIIGLERHWHRPQRTHASCSRSGRPGGTAGARRRHGRQGSDRTDRPAGPTGATGATGGPTPPRSGASSRRLGRTGTRRPTWRARRRRRRRMAASCSSRYPAETRPTPSGDPQRIATRPWLSLHIVRPMHHQRYLVTVIATNGRHPTASQYTTRPRRLSDRAGSSTPPVRLRATSTPTSAEASLAI